jgi:colanic acid/amylovoran biosynthesis glycosyltransferase
MLAPQLLHLPSARTAAAWIGLAGRLGARTLVNVGSDDLSAIAFDRPEVYGLLWSTADCFHVESETLAELLLRQGAPAHRIVVIPPTVDQPLLGERSRSESGAEPLRILSAGPLSWTQGYEPAIQAIRVLQDRGIPSEYRIVGRGAHLDAVVFAIHQLGLKDRVQVIESCSPTELRAQLRWAHVFVQLAVVPSSPKTILDAHAAGVPVITTAPPDEQPDSVLAVPALAPSALADALARLQRDEALRTSLVASGGERARRALTPAAQATRFRELHRALVADG